MVWVGVVCVVLVWCGVMWCGVGVGVGVGVVWCGVVCVCVCVQTEHTCFFHSWPTGARNALDVTV